jgi:hypothetical protein
VNRQSKEEYQRNTQEERRALPYFSAHLKREEDGTRAGRDKNKTIMQNN